MGEYHLFGIRHHGPGSARSLVKALTALEPDCILIEGPADASDAIGLVADPGLVPPVALLVYATDRPKAAVFFPFAAFSPEWQAMRYGLEKGLSVRFMDLPQTHALAETVAAQLEAEAAEKAAEASKAAEKAAEASKASGEPGAAGPAGGAAGEKGLDISRELVPSGAELAPVTPVDDPGPGDPASAEEGCTCGLNLAEQEEKVPSIQADPLGHLARAAGYDDGERWWDLTFEQRHDSREVFPAVLQAMTALRERLDEPLDEETARREAYMRQSLRKALKEGFQRIAVVCGAWHGPALASLGSARDDQDRLKGLPKVKVTATWVPWSYGRLSYQSGYGAGIASPGWYDHLWHHPQALAARWLSRVAVLLRGQDLAASSASVIEAVRLAEALAALRGRHAPDLTELNDATQAVLCGGELTPMKLIQAQLIVADRLGQVPPSAPMVPLARDLEAAQKALRLPPEVEEAKEPLELDLRELRDLKRSQLLHRLNLLDIPWGRPETASRAKGTFRERWRLRWQPDFAVRLIEASPLGNTLEEAAGGAVMQSAEGTLELKGLSLLLQRALLAELPSVIDPLVGLLQSRSAVAADVEQLMAALPPLAQVRRYGDVRRTDLSQLQVMLDGFLARIMVGLPGACASLDDEAAQRMLQALNGTQEVVALLEDEAQTAAWKGLLEGLARREGLHGLIGGRVTRILLDWGGWGPEQAEARLRYVLSPSTDPLTCAAWLEGFLQGSGLVLIHDRQLFGLVDGWVRSLTAARFVETLPALRRIFAAFPPPERRQLGELATKGAPQRKKVSEAFDEEAALAAVEVGALLLGLPMAGVRA